MKKVWEYIGKFKGLGLIIYITIILSLTSFEHNCDNIIKWIITTILSIIILIYICPKILKFVGKIEINTTEKKYEKKWLIIFFFIPFLIFFINYIIYYPGSFSIDTPIQYENAILNNYNDWHPLLQTFIAIKLPLIISNGWYGSIALCQLTIFSLALSYMEYSILKHTNKKIAFLVLFLILLNPNIRNLTIIPIKDTSFAIGVTLLMTYAMNNYFSNGEWLNKKIDNIAFIIVFTFTTIFRHNAILFTLPLLFAILFKTNKKIKIITVTSFITLYFLIRGPFYNILNVEKPNLRKTETLGLPLNVIASTIVYDEESLDKDILDFAYKISPRMIWKYTYTYGEYDDFKWNQYTNNQIIEKAGYKTILNIMFRAIKASPKTAIIGLIKTTEPVYTISSGWIELVKPEIFNNEYGIENNGIDFLKKTNKETSMKILKLFPHLFMYVGFMNLLVIIAILAKKEINKILFAFPMLIYNYGTMLLMTDFWDSIRFFYYSFIITPIILIIIFSKKVIV